MRASLPMSFLTDFIFAIFFTWTSCACKAWNVDFGR